MTIQTKATRQYFPVILFIMLSKVDLTFNYVDEFLKFGHSNESCWTVRSRGAVCFITFLKQNLRILSTFEPVQS